MPGSHLNLLFPQWQGSGPDNALYHAALALAEECADLRFSRVRVPESDRLKAQNGILGYRSILAQMAEAAYLVRDAAPDSILTVGGDCGVEPPPVSYLNDRYDGGLTVVWLDAHGDLNTPETSPSGHFHGMPLAALLGHGDPSVCRTCFSVLRPEQIILAGTRNLDPPESRLIEEMALTRVSAREMEQDRSALIRAIEKKGHPNVYLHIDMDVLDPAAFPHIRHPEPSGIPPETLADLLDRINAGFHVAGAGIMEFTLPAGNPYASPSLAFPARLVKKFF